MKTRNSDKKIKHLTLIEIVVASLILMLGVTMSTSLIGGARLQILKGEQRWGRAHAMSNATEFYLLAGPDENLPDDLLPEGFSATCNVEDVQGLPEHAMEITRWQGWGLRRYYVSVYHKNGDLLDTWEIDKILHDDDL